MPSSNPHSVLSWPRAQLPGYPTRSDASPSSPCCLSAESVSGKVMASGRDKDKLSLGFCSDLSTGQSPVGQPWGLSGRTQKAQGGGREGEKSQVPRHEHGQRAPDEFPPVLTCCSWFHGSIRHRLTLPEPHPKGPTRSQDLLCPRYLGKLQDPTDFTPKY